MADVQPTPGNPPANELTILAEFIAANSNEMTFDRYLAVMLRETGEDHEAWAGACRVPHWHDDVPCDEYERGISLGIAWLKARIEGGAANGT